MSSIRVLCVMIVLGIISKTHPVKIDRNLQLDVQMMIEMDKLQDEMTAMERGDVSWSNPDDVNGLPTFIRRLRGVIEYAKRIHDDEDYTYDDAFNREREALNKEMNANTPPHTIQSNTNIPKPVFNSYYLKIVDKNVRPFIVKAITRGLDNHDCSSIEGLVGHLLKNVPVTITHVCTDINTCATEPYPFDEFASDRSQSLTTACTADQKCDVLKALPMMTGIFYTAVLLLEQRFVCYREQKWYWGDGSSRTTTAYNEYLEMYQHFLEESELLIAYAYAPPESFQKQWYILFSEAVATNAHKDIDQALTMVKENENHFKSSRKTCTVLGVSEACFYDDLYKQYKFLTAIQENRNKPKVVKDLRMNKDIDTIKLAELQNVQLAQLQVLGEIQEVGQNLEVTATKLSEFYSGLAKFDQGIAEADVSFITGELAKYESAMIDTQNALNNQMTEAGLAMVGVLGGALVDKVTLMAAKIATNCNPLKLIFSGPDVTDILELAGDIASATVDFATGIALLFALNDLALDTYKFGDAFMGNKRQLTAMESVKDQILAGNAFNINSDADRFLEEYTAYTPTTDRSSLASNDALWSAYKDSICGFLLDTEVGIVGSVFKGIGGIQLMCEKLEGTLAQFFTLREDIFEFQFQLVDAIAAVVRGNIAHRLAENVAGKTDTSSAAEMFIGFFGAQLDLQIVVSLVCDTIEYKHLGDSYSGCSTGDDGLYRKEHLDRIIAFSETTSIHNKYFKWVEMPTRSSFKEDMAYIDVNALANGTEVVFKLPKNITWLLHYGWMKYRNEDQVEENHRGKVPFLRSIEIYLPRSNYEAGTIPPESTTTIKLKSIAGSATNYMYPKADKVYTLPRGTSQYTTTYEENVSNCVKPVVKNPYSLCNNLPDICQISERDIGEKALLPTILSTFAITLTMNQRAKQLKWDVPHSSTNLLIKARVELSLPSGVSKRSNVAKSSKKSDANVESQNDCCEGNTYKPLSISECVKCPTHSTAFLRGYFCGWNNPNEAPVLVPKEK